MKKYLLKKLGFFICFVCLTVFVKGQDFHLSQYDAAPLYLNPALAGKFNGWMRFHADYRNQWSAIATKPFTTMALSWDMPKGNWAFGAQLLNDRAGAGHFDNLSALIDIAYTFKIDKKGRNYISLGVQGGVFQQSIDMQQLYFATQYVSYNGGTFDQSIASGESVSSESFIMPDANAGLLYFYGKRGALLNPYVGASVFHVNQPKTSFYDGDNKLPLRELVHGGIKINLSSRIQLVPKGLYMYQEKASEIDPAMFLNYYWKKQDIFFILGATYRTKDASIIEGGVKFGRYTVRLSYDVNTSTLKRYTDNRGGFEASLTYIPLKPKPNPIPNCPRL